MKPYIHLLAAGLLCCLGSAANAAIVTYTYQARLTSIVEGSDLDNSAIQVAQSGFAGATLAVGDILTGVLRYDTSSPLSSYQPVQKAGMDNRMYDAGVSDYISYADKATGLAFMSMPSLNWLGSSQVFDSRLMPGVPSADWFGMTLGAMDDTMLAMASILLQDLSGNTFQSAAIPAQLSLADFYFASLEANYMRFSDRAYMNFRADITSLERVELPEPGSASLFAIAASGLFGLRRRRRA